MKLIAQSGSSILDREFHIAVGEVELRMLCWALSIARLEALKAGHVDVSADARKLLDVLDAIPIGETVQ